MLILLLLYAERLTAFKEHKRKHQYNSKVKHNRTEEKGRKYPRSSFALTEPQGTTEWDSKKSLLTNIRLGFVLNVERSVSHSLCLTYSLRLICYVTNILFKVMDHSLFWNWKLMPFVHSETFCLPQFHYVFLTWSKMGLQERKYQA